MTLTGPWLGELASLGAAITWAASVMLYRQYGPHLSATWLTFYKGLVAVMLFGVAIWFTGSWHEISLTAVFILVLSGIVGIIVGDSAFFMALPKIGGALTSSIQCAAPPLTAVGAWLFLGENLSPNQAIGLTLTCFAVAAMVWFERRSKSINPAPLSFKIGVLFAALAAICQAGGVLLSRQPLEGLPVMQGASLRLWFPVLVLGAYEWHREGGSLVQFSRTTLKVKYLWQITLASVLGTFLGLMLMVYGMTHAPVGIALGINSTYPLWIVIFDVVVFHHKMRKASFASLLCALIGVFMMVL